MDKKITNTGKFHHTTAPHTEKPQKNPDTRTFEQKNKLKDTLSKAPSMAATTRAPAETLAGLIHALQGQDLSKNPHRSLSEVLNLGFTASLLEEASCQKALLAYMQALVSILDPVTKDWETTLQDPKPLETLSLLEDIERQSPLLIQHIRCNAR